MITAIERAETLIDRLETTSPTDPTDRGATAVEVACAAEIRAAMAAPR